MQVQLTDKAPHAHRVFVTMFVRAIENPKVSESNRKAVQARLDEALTFGRSKGWNA